MTSETVRRAAAMPDMNHRDPDFLQLMRETRQALLHVYPQTAQGWIPHLIGGSGTAAVEAMISSCVKSGPVLLIDSGTYSGRAKAKLEAHQIPHEVLSCGPCEAVDLEALEREIARGYEAVLTTHHETSTGRLHPISEIGRLARDGGAMLLVDAMSSFGADPIDFDSVDALASSANKCLHGLPGISFVLVRRALAGMMAEYPKRTVYLHLPAYGGDVPPITPPVPILAALRQALRELGPEGAGGRNRNYAGRAALVRRGLEERGFRFLIPEHSRSCTLTTASIPARYSAMSGSTRIGRRASCSTAAKGIWKWIGSKSPTWAKSPRTTCGCGWPR